MRLSILWVGVLWPCHSIHYCASVRYSVLRWSVTHTLELSTLVGLRVFRITFVIPSVSDHFTRVGAATIHVIYFNRLNVFTLILCRHFTQGSFTLIKDTPTLSEGWALLTFIILGCHYRFLICNWGYSLCLHRLCRVSLVLLVKIYFFYSYIAIVKLFFMYYLAHFHLCLVNWIVFAKDCVVILCPIFLRLLYYLREGGVTGGSLLLFLFFTFLWRRITTLVSTLFFLWISLILALFFL